MRLITYFLCWVLVLFGFNYAATVSLGMLGHWLGIHSGLWLFGLLISLTPHILAAARISHWVLARKIELPLAYKGWTYRIAAASLVLVACNFALAYIVLIGGRGASGLPPIICILGATIALFMAEISDWYRRLALLPNARRWSTMLVVALGFVVFWFLYSPIRSRLGFVGAFAVFVFFLIGIRLSARYAARFGSRVV